jgi:two-component system NarL family sensor kinase
MDLVERSMSGVRTLSYLLHPPLLDESGLLPAVRWYVEGFARRSGIKVDLDAPLTMERLPRDVETTLFRVVQEALINIHRHAQSATARLRLRLDEDVTLEVQDDGRGMAPELVARLMSGGGGSGVGIAGIRERLTPLAGALEIESSERGTTVRAVVPLPSRTL